MPEKLFERLFETYKIADCRDDEWLARFFEKYLLHDELNVTFVNPYSFEKVAKAYEEGKVNFNEKDIVFLDGIFFVWLMRLFRVSGIKRASFDMTSVAPIIFSWCENNKASIALIGGRDGAVDITVERIKSQYPGLIFLVARHGYFESKQEINEFIQTLTIKSPRIVIAGLGSPFQEEFLYQLRRCGWKGVGFTCGGFIEQTFIALDYYPNWINYFNIRWIYRLFMEPRRLWYRYFVQYPLYTFQFLKRWNKYIISKRSKEISS